MNLYSNYYYRIFNFNFAIIIVTQFSQIYFNPTNFVIIIIIHFTLIIKTVNYTMTVIFILIYFNVYHMLTLIIISMNIYYIPNYFNIIRFMIQNVDEIKNFNFIFNYFLIKILIYFIKLDLLMIDRHWIFYH